MEVLGRVHISGHWLPDICRTGEEKPRKNLNSANFSRPGIEPGPAAWQARMQPVAPQRWTFICNKIYAIIKRSYLFIEIMNEKSLCYTKDTFFPRSARLRN